MSTITVDVTTTPTLYIDSTELITPDSLSALVASLMQAGGVLVIHPHRHDAECRCAFMGGGESEEIRVVRNDTHPQRPDDAG